MASLQAEAGLSQQLGLRASPELVAAREMLQLPSIALEAAVEAELGSNPALERAESYECPLCFPSGGAACPLCQPGRSGGRGAGGREHDLVPTVPYRENDADILLRDVRLAILSRDYPIAEYLVGNLDDHGFLDQEPGQAAAALGVSAGRVLEVLGAIQRHGPPGVGTAGIRNCLLVQLEQLAAGEDVHRLARSVIEDHLPALARGHLTAICRALGVGRAALDAAAELIRTRLHPYPAYEGRSLSTSLVLHSGVPNVVIIERADGAGGFEVDLVEPGRFRLQINSSYLRAAATVSDVDRDHVRASLAEARSFLARLEDRWRTLRRVAELVTEFQSDFVRRGPLCLRPLTRAQVAAELLMHESTVSRAVASKYVLLPSRKVVALAEFFSSSGGLGEEIRAMIAAETHPLSDEQLTVRLRERGYQVARRTVTKYRLRAGIAAAAVR